MKLPASGLPNCQMISTIWRPILREGKQWQWWKMTSPGTPLGTCLEVSIVLQIPDVQFNISISNTNILNTIVLWMCPSHWHLFSLHFTYNILKPWKSQFYLTQSVTPQIRNNKIWLYIFVNRNNKSDPIILISSFINRLLCSLWLIWTLHGVYSMIKHFVYY